MAILDLCHTFGNLLWITCIFLIMPAHFSPSDYGSTEPNHGRIHAEFNSSVTTGAAAKLKCESFLAYAPKVHLAAIVHAAKDWAVCALFIANAPKVFSNLWIFHLKMSCFCYHQSKLTFSTS
jgi:hypothetical protein